MSYRINHDPFEVKEILPLGTSIERPYFGVGSIDDDDTTVGRTLLLCGIPDTITITELVSIFKTQFPTVEVVAGEILMNPSGKQRPLAILELKNRKDVSFILNSKYSVTWPRSSLVIKPLPNMLYPDRVRMNSCSVLRDKLCI